MAVYEESPISKMDAEVKALTKNKKNLVSNNLGLGMAWAMVKSHIEELQKENGRMKSTFIAIKDLGN